MMTSQIRNKLALLAQRRLRVERRQVKRLILHQRTICQVRLPGGEFSPAGSVQNLSLQGVGLLTERDYPPGTCLHVLLVNAPHTFALALDMKVVRSFRAANGLYYVGGPFTHQLLHEEVVPFVI
jgi:hypothetical protein